MHKNSNEALGNDAIYEILVYRKTYKIGKADLDRITLSSGDPTRIHQQLRKLRLKYGVQNVIYDIVESLFGITTEEAKAFERAILQLVYERDNIVPQGNQKNFKPQQTKTSNDS